MTSLFSKKRVKNIVLIALFSIIVFFVVTKTAPVQAGQVNLTVRNNVVGISTRYIGACEGNVAFNIADLQNLGINTYRIYGGMSRWEPEDDDSSYGLPTIEQIKRDPNVIAWDRWDQVMTAPESGSDYAFSGQPAELWQGSAQTIFQELKRAHIKPVLTLRNSDPGWQPAWALQLNPPRTRADWNEWWEHVFATVYWLNVRNDYRVDDFEVHNEPGNRQQGWGGNDEDYFNLVRVSHDAIRYVYDTYLPGRTYHIHAPKSVGGSQLPQKALNNVADLFDVVNVHNYDADISEYLQKVHRWMAESEVHRDSPLWLGEWGTYTEGYDDLQFSLNLVKNMIRGSQPANYHVYGSHIFSLYDWGENNIQGLIDFNGHKRLSYYAFRMGIRALQGGKRVLESINSSNIEAMATWDLYGNVYLLMVNDQNHSLQASIDVSELNPAPEAKLWEFNGSISDQVVATPTLKNGRTSLELDANSAFILEVPVAR